MLRTLPSLSSILLALSLAGFTVACDDDTSSTSSSSDAGNNGGSDTGNGGSNTGNGGSDTGNSGSNTGSGGSEDRERPTRPPASEATPPTPASDRVAEASDRAVRDAAENRTPAEVPDEAAQPFDDETVALGAELFEYCWDACDLTDIFLLAPDGFRAACYENCVDDLERVLSDLSADDEGKDCLDAVVESLFCETSFESSTIDGVCDEFENDVLAVSGVCDPEYEDVSYYCFAYDDVLLWFFEEDGIGGSDLLPDEPGEPGEPGDDVVAEIDALLEEVAAQCIEDCYAIDLCLEPDPSETDECLLNCDDELSVLEASLAGGGDEEADCLVTIAEFYDCRLLLTCDEILDEELDGVFACETEYDEAAFFCGAFIEL